MTRAELCVAACEGIPDDVLVDGLRGLKGWLCGKYPAYDEALWIGDLGRHLPVRRCRTTLLKWVTEGVRRRDGTVVKLETIDGPRGERCASLEAYHRMQLRLDGRQIVTLERVGQGRLCMAMCSRCEAWQKFAVPADGVREELLKGTYGWRQDEACRWLCLKCAKEKRR